ncbi:MAG: YHYH protein [Geminicoccales bacterium]
MNRMSMVLGLGALSSSAITDAARADMSGSNVLNEVKALFAEGAIVSNPEIVDCKLSGGTETQCVAITETGEPVDHQTGLWCPTNVSDSEKAGGIWLENDQVYNVDGAFIENLAIFYDDTVWRLFDPDTGKIRGTDTLDDCQAAARPNVDPAYTNYCVQCELDYMGRSTERTYVLPLKPVLNGQPNPVTGNAGTGVALNGVRLDGAAPKDAILGARTLAPFDDCGGHINLHVGYHYHAATGCSTEVLADDQHAPVIGIAMGGFKLHARLNPDGSSSDDLDACRGHVSEGLGYHYHANNPDANAILPCHAGETGCTNEGSETACDATNRPVRRPPPQTEN